MPHHTCSSLLLVSLSRWCFALLPSQHSAAPLAPHTCAACCDYFVPADPQHHSSEETGLCYTEKAPNAWQRRGTQKTRNTYNQPNRPNRQTSQTKHQALPEGQPGRRITPINTAALHASAQQQPTISTHTRQGHHQIFSANADRSRNRIVSFLPFSLHA